MKSRGKLLFSYRLTEGAFSGVERKDTGVFFYLKNSTEPNLELGAVVGFRMKRGKVVEKFGKGSFDSDKIRQQMERIAFEPFDYKAEVKRVKAILQEEAKRSGYQIIPPFALDGGDYEIRYVYGSVDYTLNWENPMTDMEFYARYSPKIAKLKALIDCFAQSCGREELNL